MVGFVVYLCEKVNGGMLMVVIGYDGCCNFWVFVIDFVELFVGVGLCVILLF